MSNITRKMQFDLMFVGNCVGSGGNCATVVRTDEEQRWANSERVVYKGAQETDGEERGVDEECSGFLHAHCNYHAHSCLHRSLHRARRKRSKHWDSNTLEEELVHMFHHI